MFMKNDGWLLIKCDKILVCLLGLIISCVLFIYNKNMLFVELFKI